MNVTVNGDIIIETAPQSMSSKPSVEIKYIEITVGHNVYLIKECPGGIQVEEVNGMYLFAHQGSASLVTIS